MSEYGCTKSAYVSHVVRTGTLTDDLSMLANTQVHKEAHTYNLHLFERLLYIATVPNKVHQGRTPCARVRISAITTQWLTTSSEEPRFDAIILNLCCPDPTVMVVEGLTEGVIRTIDATIVTAHTLKVLASLSGSAVVLHLARCLSGMQAELIPCVLRDAFDDIKLGVPFLLVGGVVE